jgi:hypothetical protein
VFIRLLQEDEVGREASQQDGSDKSKEEKMIAKKYLGKLEVEGSLLVKQLKTKVFQELIKDKDLGEECRVSSEDEIRLRNPKNEYMGD